MAASTAISAQGTTITVGSSGSAKNITAITKANPAVVTSNSHGLASGAVVELAAIGGMVELNGKVAVIEVLTVNTFRLLGYDSTNYTTYTSGGTATPIAATVGNVKSYAHNPAPKAQVDVTHMGSDAKEFIGGLQDRGTCDIAYDVDDTDKGQMALRSSLAGSGIRSTFVITLRNTKTRTFSGEVFSVGESASVDEAVRSSTSIRITGPVTLGG